MMGFYNMASSYSEPNTILEINEAHADNFMLVITKLPTAHFLGSSFNTLTRPEDFGMSEPTSGIGDQCGDGPEYDPNNPVHNTSTLPPSSTGQTECEKTQVQQSRLRREANLDMANFKLYISDVVLPDVNVAKVTIPTQFHDMSRASKLTVGDLTTTMMVSENLLNYNALLYWLYALHNPEEYNKISGRQMIQDYFTTIYLIITNNHRTKIAEFEFIDAFPINLSNLAFSYKNADKLTANVTWAHSGMIPSDRFVLRYV